MASSSHGRAASQLDSEGKINDVFDILRFVSQHENGTLQEASSMCQKSLEHDRTEQLTENIELAMRFNEQLRLFHLKWVR